jgi:HD-GYP domain-containing protein (c-di-GMP phosphodiesterase class II)
MGKDKNMVVNTQSAASYNEEDPYNGSNNYAIQEASTMLDFLHEVGKKVGSVSKLNRLIKQVMRMTQHTLNAEASSILLLDNDERTLRFEIAEGESERILKQLKLDLQSGIAGWVARYKKPLIINDVMRHQCFDRSVDKMTGFTTKSIICAPLLVHRRLIGVIEVLNKTDGSDFSAQDLGTLTSVASTAAMAIENTQLHQSVLDAYKSTIKALAAAIDAKDHYTRGHSQRVMEYTLMGAEYLSFPREELEVLEYAGILHDIGKIGIDDRILSKSAQLTDEEWEIMCQHPRIGAEILKGIPLLKKARAYILHHHERFDGSGYPDGLKQEGIPMGARLLAVADAFDTMTTDRAYRVRVDVDTALKELYNCSGTQFCPEAVNAFFFGYQEHVNKKCPSTVLLDSEIEM